MKIQNFQQLATTGLRDSALRIAEAGLAAIHTSSAVRSAVSFKDGTLRAGEEVLELQPDARLIVVAVGKCALEAANALEEILGDRISTGVVIDVHPGELRRLRTFSGDHPFPSERNVSATKELITVLQGLSEKDVVLAVVSGGGSTLLCQPQNHTCLEERKFLECLFRGGATIEEINTVRKHTSVARGGWLAQYAYPARVASLIFSDVPGDKEEFVASGPTVLDKTTIKDAEEVLERYRVRETCGLEKMELMETPKEEKYFKKAKNILVVSNHLALLAMAKAAGELGFAAKVETSEMRGEARQEGEKIAKSIAAAPAKSAFLYGGETTVTVKGAGRGGRNRELALGALTGIGGGELVLSLASDGRDNGPSAGALCDMMTKEKAAKLGLTAESFLAENNSEEFFQKTGDEILTGDTGSNVSDLAIALKE